VIAAAALSYAATAVRADLVYDNVSNAEAGTDGVSQFVFIGTNPNPNTGKVSSGYGDNAGGGYFALAPGTTALTGLDLFPIIGVTNVSTGQIISSPAYNYSGLKITVDVWGTLNLGTVNSSNQAFSNLLGTYTLTDYVGAGAFVNGNIYNFENSAAPGVIPGITLTTPIVIPSTVGHDSIGEPVIGISYIVQATNASSGVGATYAAVNGVAPSFTLGSPASVGDQSLAPNADFNTVFFFNNTNEQTGNFKEGPYSFTGYNDSALALRAYGTVVPVPEPTSLSLLGLSAAALLRRRKNVTAAV
jgi:hypothetical protein